MSRAIVSSSSGSSRRGLALVLGVANHRSIAWACVQSFVNAGHDCIFTYKSDRFKSTSEKLTMKQQQSEEGKEPRDHQQRCAGRIVGSFPCDVATDGDLELLFQERIPQFLDASDSNRTIDAVVHSIAYADFEGRPFSGSSWDAYAECQKISAYSFLRSSHLARPLMNSVSNFKSPSMTALTYLGSSRAVPNYHIMGPAKASLEAIVRGLAMEFGAGSGSCNTGAGGDDDDGPPTPSSVIRVNAVSAGPISTLAARGIPKFGSLHKQAAFQSPLGRPVDVAEVADVVNFLSMQATGVTGQVVHVDGGYSSIVPVSSD